jgi:hypothetical protein
MVAEDTRAGEHGPCALRRWRSRFWMRRTDNTFAPCKIFGKLKMLRLRRWLRKLLDKFAPDARYQPVEEQEEDFAAWS